MALSKWGFIFKEETSKVYLYLHNDPSTEKEEGHVVKVEDENGKVKVILETNQMLLDLRWFTVDTIFGQTIGQQSSCKEFVNKFNIAYKAATAFSFHEESNDPSNQPVVSVDEVEVEENSFGLFYHVDVDNLVEPDNAYKQYRVRELNNHRVNQLAENLLATSKMPWSGPPLHVMAINVKNKQELVKKMVMNTRFVVIDGNHRYCAIKKARHLSGVKVFLQVPCLVYFCLSPEEALTIGCQGNRTSENVLQMTDFDKVKLFRGLFPEFLSIYQSRVVTETDLKKIYNIFGLETRKEKQTFNPVTNLTKQSTRCWEIIKDKFLENSKLKASVFNCIAGLKEETCYESLQLVAKSKDFSKLKQLCKEQKSNKVSKTVVVEFQDNRTTVSCGQTVLYGQKIEIKLKESTYILSSSEMELILDNCDLSSFERIKESEAESNNCSVLKKDKASGKKKLKKKVGKTEKCNRGVENIGEVEKEESLHEMEECQREIIVAPKVNSGEVEKEESLREMEECPQEIIVAPKVNSGEVEKEESLREMEECPQEIIVAPKVNSGEVEKEESLREMEECPQEIIVAPKVNSGEVEKEESLREMEECPQEIIVAPKVNSGEVEKEESLREMEECPQEIIVAPKVNSGEVEKEESLREMEECPQEIIVAPKVNSGEVEKEESLREMEECPQEIIVAPKVNSGEVEKEESLREMEECPQEIIVAPEVNSGEVEKEESLREMEECPQEIIVAPKVNSGEVEKEESLREMEECPQEIIVAPKVNSGKKSNRNADIMPKKETATVEHEQRQKRLIKRKTFFNADESLSQTKRKKGNEMKTATSLGIHTDENASVVISPEKNDDYHMNPYPSVVAERNWILINPGDNTNEEEDLPWIGYVTKIKGKFIHFDWCEGDFGKDWNHGTLTPKSNKTTIDKILASFSWDENKFSNKMPDKLDKNLKRIWEL